MILLSAIASAAAAPPAVQVRHHQGAAWLTILPPSGEHINTEGPLRGWLEVDGLRVELTGSGALLAAGVPVAAARGDVLTGELQVSLCEDGGDVCRLAEVGFSGSVGRRASILPPWQAPPPPAAPHAESLDAALAAAAESGRQVLLDFGAVWCPPCNLLSAQVLDDPDNAADLEGFVVVTLDADDPSSFASKDRYQVGGYPTMIIVDADGVEIDRLLGYPGESQTLAWLAQAPQQQARSSLPAVGSLDAPASASVAWRLAQQGQSEEAAAWLAAAAAAEDTPSFRLARLSLEGRAEDVLWLVEQGEPLEAWLWDGLGPATEDEGAAAALKQAIGAALPAAEPALASDLLYALAQLAPAADRPLLYAASAAALHAAMTGDPAQDRGQWTSLAHLHEQAGDVDGGLAVLEQAIAHYPEEFTFHYAIGGMLLRAERTDEAIDAARAALSHSYGDNRLRAARLLAEALHAGGQSAEALAVIDEALSAAPDVTDLDVRTPRYIEHLQEARAEIAGEP